MFELWSHRRARETNDRELHAAAAPGRGAVLRDLRCLTWQAQALLWIVVPAETAAELQLATYRLSVETLGKLSFTVVSP